MKILITGSSGQLGKELINLKPSGMQLITPNKSKFNLTYPNICEKYIIDNKPEWIINCAAYTNVEKAEFEKDLALLINSTSVKFIASAAKKINCNFIQLSTDYVFNGQKREPYLPEDKKSPLNVYGKTKSIGEDYVRSIFGDSGKGYIIRTSWLMGARGNNFTIKILKLLLENEKINVIGDQLGSLTTTNTLAKACWKLIDISSKNKSIPQILHITNDGYASWHDIAVEILNISRGLGILKSPKIINNIRACEYKTKAERPKYSVLDCEESLKAILFKTNPWREALNELLLEYKKEN